MTSPLERKYAPKSINEVIFPNDLIEARIKRIIAGPHFEHLLFYGHPGTGKSSTAQLIPREIEKKQNAYVIYRDGSHSRSIDDIRSLVSQVHLFPCGKVHYVIIDEAENLTSDAQKCLKEIMQRASFQSMFILITNEIEKINDAIGSRCRKINFDQAPAFKWKPRVAEILEMEMGKPPNPKAVEKIVALARGDVREIFRYCDDEIAGLLPY